ncbi:MAG TPA: ABC transporter permease subunit [Draconibacterium sp.]|nr:ABC transporter permease subunit [Draconibacterium sp.]
MKRILLIELTKILHRTRSFLSIGLMAILIGLIFWGLKSQGESALDYILQALNRNFIVNGNILNGYLAIYIILNTLWIHVPILIVIVTGDLFSSELETGTIRLLLSRPVKRYKLILVKYLTAVIFVFFFILIWSVFSVLPALLLFGKGDLIVVFNGLQILEEKVLFTRFVLAFGFAFIGMSAFAIFSVAVSIFTRKTLNAILITLGFLVISTLLQTLAPTLFVGWESFLITHHLARWQLLFYSEPDFMDVLNSVIWLLGFSVVCILASLIRFNRLKITE